MKNIIASLLVSFLLLTACSDSSEEKINAAKERLTSGKNAEAISLLDQLLSESENSTAYNLRGVAYFNEEKNSKALEDFSNAIRLEKTNYQYYYNRGNVKRKLRDKEGAIDDYTAALALDSTQYEVYLNRALVYLNNAQPLKAIDDFKKALTFSNGEDFRVYHYRGEAYLRLEDFARAEKDFRKCLALDGQVAAAYLGLATSLIAQNDTDTSEACGHIQKAIDLGMPSAQEMKKQYCGE